MTGSRMIDGRLAAQIDRGSPVDRSFPKAYRLRLRREFVAVQASPLCVRGQLLLLAAQSDGDGRIGITVSKQVGNAVVRNRVRRQIREAIRHHGRAREKVRANWVPQGYNVVVIARRAAAHSHFFELQEELKRLRKRLPQ